MPNTRVSPRSMTLNSNNKKKRYKRGRCPRFHDEQVAFDYVEAALWPQGPVCPHCTRIPKQPSY